MFQIAGFVLRHSIRVDVCRSAVHDAKDPRFQRDFLSTYQDSDPDDSADKAYLSC